MTLRTGPRRLVLLAQERDQGNLLKGAAPVKLDPPINTVKIHSSSVPSLQQGTTFTATVSQLVDLPEGKKSYSKSQDFKVNPSSSSLDNSLIHSVYPPSGHSDYWNVLPHMLFTNLQIPWMLNTLPPSDPNAKRPWLGLLVFSHDELFMSAADIKDVTTTSPAVQGPNLTVTMSEAEFAAAAKQTAGPAQTPIDTIWLNTDLFQAVFSDADRFQYLTHVRTVNTQGMSNMVGDEAGTYSVVVSARPGPQSPAAPTIAYVHLVAIPPDSGKTQYKSARCGLRSLYSWQYTCLPSTHYSITKSFQTLSQSTQPLRNVDATINKSQDPHDTWIQKRMLAGYSLARYRPQTGETTMCLFRGPLIPNDPFDANLSSRDLPPSDVGTDLAILDREVGLLDISFQLAWSLGRTLAMADRGVSAALMRVRTNIHNAALNVAKAAVDRGDSLNGALRASSGRQAALHPILDTLSTIKASCNNVQATSAVKATPSDGSQLISRWGKANTSTGTRALCTFVNDGVKDMYCGCLDDAACDIACAVGSKKMLSMKPKQLRSGDSSDITRYDEFNQPASTDYALLLGWMLDKWFLHGIPMYNLIPDESFLPRETLRTFYVDPTWFKTFMDGALSIGDHFTPMDDARESLKAQFTAFLNTPGKRGYKPPIPRWGFFIRSTLIEKFSDLRITAPWSSDGSPDADDGRPQTIRMEQIDTGLLLVLFDRIPGPNHSLYQISLHPPEHQMCFMLGTMDGLGVSQNGSTTLSIQWKAATVDKISLGQTIPAPTILTSGDKGPFDFGNNLIDSKNFATLAQKNLQDMTQSPKSPAALVGAQLIASFPQMILQARATSGVSNAIDISNSLSTTKGRIQNTLVQSRQPLLKAPSVSTTSPPQPSPSPLPTYGMLRSQYANLAKLADTYIKDPGDVEKWFYNGGGPDMFDRDNMWCPYDGLEEASWIQRYKFRVYNVFTNIYNATDRYNTFAVMPLSLGVLTDLNVSVTPRLPTFPRGWLLNAIEFCFPMQTHTPPVQGAMFMPFPNSTDANKNLNNSPGQSKPQDFEHRPTFNGLKLPNIRQVGLRNKWLFQGRYDTSFHRETFIVRAIPNTPNGTYDVVDNVPLEFVIEDVQISWEQFPSRHNLAPIIYSNQVTMSTNEYYTSTPDSQTPQKLKGVMETKVAALDGSKNFEPKYDVTEYWEY